MVNEPSLVTEESDSVIKKDLSITLTSMLSKSLSDVAQAKEDLEMKKRDKNKLFTDKKQFGFKIIDVACSSEPIDQQVQRVMWLQKDREVRIARERKLRGENGRDHFVSAAA
jgi:hypothetical protein